MPCHTRCVFKWPSILLLWADLASLMPLFRLALAALYRALSLEPEGVITVLEESLDLICYPGLLVWVHLDVFVFCYIVSIGVHIGEYSGSILLYVLILEKVPVSSSKTILQLLFQAMFVFKLDCAGISKRKSLHLEFAIW